MHAKTAFPVHLNQLRIVCTWKLRVICTPNDDRIKNKRAFKRSSDWRWITCLVCLSVSSNIRWKLGFMSRRTMAKFPSMCFLLVNLVNGVNIRLIPSQTQRKLRFIPPVKPEQSPSDGHVLGPSGNDPFLKVFKMLILFSIDLKKKIQNLIFRKLDTY